MSQTKGKRKKVESQWLTSSPTKRAMEEKESNAKQKKQKKKERLPKKTPAGKKSSQPKKTKAGGQGDNTEDVCCYCKEGVGVKSELWLKCGICGKWAHEACTSGMTSRGFFCDWCR